MGALVSTVSLYNDTDDPIMVKVTANTAIIAPIVTGFVAIGGGLVTLMTGGLAGSVAVAGTTLTYSALAGATTAVTSVLANTITKTVLADFEKSMESGYMKEGYAKVNPGERWTSGSQTLSLNLRMWLTRLDGDGKTLSIRTADSSVWAGSTAGSDRLYTASDTNYFAFETMDTYNVDIKTRGGALDQRGGAIHETKRGNSLMAGVVSGLLLASPFKSAGFGGMNNKRGLSSQGPFSRPLALGARPRSSFEAKISELLK